MTAVAASILVSASAIAQVPDFSGTWTLDRMERSEDGGGAAAPTLVIKQDRETLRVEQRGGCCGIVRAEYGLAGQTTQNLLHLGGAGFSVPARYTSTWDGAKLVTVMVVQRSLVARDIETDEDRPAVLPNLEVRFLRPDGVMIVETRRIIQGRTVEARDAVAADRTRLVWTAVYRRSSPTSR